LRREWILKRGDVAEYDGREVKPQDNAIFGQHAEYASKAEKNRLVNFRTGEPASPSVAREARDPSRRCWYARQGIITPEMDTSPFARTRASNSCARNLARRFTQFADAAAPGSQQRNDVFSRRFFKRFPQRMPKFITAEFVREKWRRAGLFR